MHHLNNQRQPFNHRIVHQPMPPMYSQAPFNQPPPMTPKHSLKQLAIRGVNGLTKTLDHLQTFANAMESAGPIIEKYKPVVKNLPMMLQMLRAMQETEEKEAPKDSKKPHEPSQRELDGLSKPKLYIE